MFDLKMGKREKIVLKQLVDIEDLAGVFATEAKKITKGMTQKEIELAESKVMEEVWGDRFN